VNAVQDIFSRNGPIARAMKSYTMRSPQVAMAMRVAHVIENEGVLLAEAGTGTGKTLAYLVPVILADCKTVISTGTKNLQDQIYFKDIAFLSEVFNRPLSAVYLKGQDNYLCQRRLFDFLRSPAVLVYPPKQVEMIRRFANETETGDRMELPELADDASIWREICSTKETRIGAKCPNAGTCFVTWARQQAQRARIVIVNHHLYFADVATRQRGGALLPKHDLVVFDEAHGIEDVATEFFSMQVSSRQIDRLVTDALRTVESARLVDDPAENRRETLAARIKRSGADFFSLFRDTEGKRGIVPEEIPAKGVTAYYQLDNALDAFEQSLNLLSGQDETVDHTAMRVKEIRDTLARLVTESSTGYVNWVENRRRSVILGASPIDVSAQIREGVFFSVPSVVLTSATLSTNGNFAFLKSRLGIDFDTVELTAASPFDFENQACLFIPEGLPDPRDPAFIEAAGEIVLSLIEMTGGGALLLSTSYRNMTSLHEIVEGKGIGPVLLQGSAPKTHLLDRFAKEQNSILVATASFWQGVDLPGDMLRLVIIDKLPFAAPTDPLESARIDHLRMQGKRPFIEYQVPAAALQLKQGFGRLIRTEHDKGVVAILDRRLTAMPYGRIFLNSLPPCPRITSMADLKVFWERLVKKSA
jgi:ATP-dependent DNA helicase DinG